MITDGKNAEELIRHTTWNKVIRALQERALISLMKLVSVDAEDARSIRTLQNDIRMYKDLVLEVDGIIKDGRSAELINKDLQEFVNEGQ